MGVEYFPIHVQILWFLCVNLALACHLLFLDGMYRHCQLFALETRGEDSPLVKVKCLECSIRCLVVGDLTFALDFKRVSSCAGF